MAGVILIGLLPVDVCYRDGGLPSQGRRKPARREENPSVTDPAAASVKCLLIAAAIIGVHDRRPAILRCDDIVLQCDDVVAIALTIGCAVEVERIEHRRRANDVSLITTIVKRVDDPGLASRGSNTGNASRC